MLVSELKHKLKKNGTVKSKIAGGPKVGLFP